MCQCELESGYWGGGGLPVCLTPLPVCLASVQRYSVAARYHFYKLKDKKMQTPITYKIIQKHKTIPLTYITIKKHNRSSTYLYHCCVIWFITWHTYCMHQAKCTSVFITSWRERLQTDPITGHSVPEWKSRVMQWCCDTACSLGICTIWWTKREPPLHALPH